MKQILLTNSPLFALVDDADFVLVNQYKWRTTTSHRATYAVTGAAQEPYCNRQFLHNLLVDTHADLLVDHKDNNGLNNQRSNLRVASRSQNKANGNKYSNNTSGYKGVTFRRERETWRAQIRVNNKLVIIGCYKDKEEAARAYDKAALLYFGAFAKLNFPPSWGEMDNAIV